MADKELRIEGGVSGNFYVDEECICCGLCGEIAPGFFRESDEGGHHIVHRQPASDEDLELAREALAECPVEAIGDDGD